MAVDFCQWVARPSRPELFVSLRQIQAIAREFVAKPVFLHVPREFNGLADWLANVAREAKGNLSMGMWCVGLTPQSFPPCSPLWAV